MIVGERKNAKRFRKVGGKAFPNDYNWVCPVCEAECRGFELTCSYCEWEETRADIKPNKL